MTNKTCGICGDDDLNEFGDCILCLQVYGEALCDSHNHAGKFVMGLKSGIIIAYRECTINEDWVFIESEDIISHTLPNPDASVAGGLKIVDAIHIAVSAIEWVTETSKEGREKISLN